MITKKLKDIVAIRSGYLFEKRTDKDNKGNVLLFQMKDINKKGIISYDDFSSTFIEDTSQMEFLKKGEIIFRAKSIYQTASAIKYDIDKLLPTIHFLILTVKTDTILSEYLSWFINQRPAQKYFGRLAAGSRFPIVTKKILSELIITIPDLKTQKAILKINELKQKEIQLRKELNKKREILITENLLNLIQER